jgi:bacterioferritin (cytochrome b1)
MELPEMQSEGEEQAPVNRTGIMTNPQLSAELINGAEETEPDSEGDAADLALIREAYITEAASIGSVPVVLEVSEDGENAGAFEGLESLLDKLGERLAFERQGTRLYETALQKCEALVIQDEVGPSIEELQHICNEELEHFKLLQKAIIKLGGDATLQTPSADVAGILSLGMVQVVSDPRTTVPQMLQALLTAELVDNDGWQLLGDLAAELGQDELEEQCRKALEEEQEHLEKVREWVLSMAMEEAAVGAELEEEGEDEDIADQVGDEQESKSRKAKSSSSTKSKKKPKKE